jgi:hypothetical protein
VDGERARAIERTTLRGCTNARSDVTAVTRAALAVTTPTPRGA